MVKGFQDLLLATWVNTQRWTRHSQFARFPGLRLTQTRAYILLLFFVALILSHKHHSVCLKSLLETAPHIYSIVIWVP